RRVRAHAGHELPGRALVPGRLARPGPGGARTAVASAEGPGDLPLGHVGALVVRADPRGSDPGDLVEAPDAGDARPLAGGRIRRRDARRRWRVTAARPRPGSGARRAS